jgi:hypothetical protein
MVAKKWKWQEEMLRTDQTIRLDKTDKTILYLLLTVIFKGYKN